MDILKEYPVIAAVRDAEGLRAAVKSVVRVVFLLQGSLLELGSDVQALAQTGKAVFVHIDLIDGLRADAAGLRYIKEFVGAPGIISTRAQTIKQARALGFATILRTFALDSRSLQAAQKSVHECGPHAVEVLPGCSAQIIQRIKRYVDVPLIAGGLIQSGQDIQQALKAGAVAVSVSDAALWDIDRGV